VSDLLALPFVLPVPAWPVASGLPFFDRAIFAYFVVLVTAYGTLVAAALWELLGHVLRVRGEARHWVLGSAVSPSISIIAPAYNEEATIAESVTALLALHYANLEVVVVNDGSPDGTLDVLRERFALVPVHTIVWRRLDTKPVRQLYRSRTHPNLVVVDKENGGKADALNVGLNLATGDLVCVIDADTIVDSDALPRLARPFLADAATIATGGMIRVANGSRVAGGRVLETRAPVNPLAGMQVSEYLRAFLFGRLGWNRLGGTLIISGAFGLFRREAMIAAGGYTHDTVGEDMELVLKLRRRAYEARERHRVVFVPDAVAWTEVPESARVLGRQRDRWHRGLADVLWRHRGLIGNPRYGAMGLVGLPYFVVVELLAPVTELIGWIALVTWVVVGALNAEVALLFFALAYGLNAIHGALAVLADELSFPRYRRIRDRLAIIGWAMLETFGYRQLTVLWRVRGLWRFLRGRTDWGRMERRGFSPPAAGAAIVPRPVPAIASGGNLDVSAPAAATTSTSPARARVPA
jgi:cellulose synthase/poly-beta-1,6-N-acetylglucosamine synthase-like glycosyltransferase